MKILILKRYEREFRVPFYQLLSKKLIDNNIQFNLFYGEPDVDEKKSIKDYIKDDSLGTKVDNVYIRLFGINLCYQPCFSYCSGNDLIIVQQGNKELINYIILLRRVFFRKTKVAFWGHGRNFQGNPNSLKEKFKKWYSSKVDFWFAYNDLSMKHLIDIGINENKIVAINNTIDTSSQIEMYEKINAEQKFKLKQKYGIESTDPIGIFCASIYKDKQIDFLLRTLSIVKEKVPNFKYFVIGKGVEDFKIVEFSKKNKEWFFYLGNKFNEEKIMYFSIADFQTIPGAVGLNIIDSFSFLCPLITTSIDNHGPEISYLINKGNGIMTSFEVEVYASTIISLISDNKLLSELKQGCRKSREIYSIENMVNNFVNGLLKIKK
jgi:glycosyltransferase involved in cell wall biosynthesis